jgi:hypothetical protein
MNTKASETSADTALPPGIAPGAVEVPMEVKYRRGAAARGTQFSYGRVPASYVAYVDGVARGELRGVSLGYSRGYRVYLDGAEVSRFPVSSLLLAKLAFERAFSSVRSE